MSLLAKAGSGDREFKVVPQGVHLGRCYRVIDLGTQETEFQGKSRKSRKVLLSWELFGEDEAGNPLEMDDGRPLSINKRYTLSLSEKASLRADLEAWRGRAFTEDELQGFDLKALLGVYGLVNVTHTQKGDKTYSNVAGISPLPKAMREHRPAPINENEYFEVAQKIGVRNSFSLLIQPLLCLHSSMIKYRKFSDLRQVLKGQSTKIEISAFSQGEKINPLLFY